MEKQEPRAWTLFHAELDAQGLIEVSHGDWAGWRLAAEPVPGARLHDLLPLELQGPIASALQAAGEVGAHCSGALQLASSSRWMEVLAYRGSRACTLLLQDVTAGRQVEAALHDTEGRFRTLFETTGTVTFAFDERAVIRVVNTEFERQTGYSRAQTVGRMKATDFVHSGDLQTVMEYHRQRGRDPRKAPASYEIRVRDRSGRERVGLATIRVVPGSTLRIVSFLDHTELKQAQRQVQRAEKLAALGQIITGVAHEIANPVHFIQFNLPTLRRYHEALLALAGETSGAQAQGMSAMQIGQELEALVDDLDHGAALMTDLVEQLRSHARDDTPMVLSAGAVGPIVDRALALVGPQARKLVGQVDTRAQARLPFALMDARKLQQVLVNLIINAAQAAAGPDGHVLVNACSSQRTGMLEIQVTDNGCGIPAHVQHQIFDPFYTTKPRGTGLGLWISQGIVREMGGEIRVESHEGEGTTMRVLLNMAQA